MTDGRISDIAPDSVQGSVSATGIASFLVLLHELALKGFLLAVFERRGLLEVLSLLPLADDPFFLDHSLETLDGFLERLAFVDDYLPNINHLPLKPNGDKLYLLKELLSRGRGQVQPRGMTRTIFRKTEAAEAPLSLFSSRSFVMTA